MLSFLKACLQNFGLRERGKRGRVPQKGKAKVVWEAVWRTQATKQKGKKFTFSHGDILYVLEWGKVCIAQPCCCVAAKAVAWFLCWEESQSPVCVCPGSFSLSPLDQMTDVPPFLQEGSSFMGKMQKQCACVKAQSLLLSACSVQRFAKPKSSMCQVLFE